jgi:hypothetical protein
MVGNVEVGPTVKIAIEFFLDAVGREVGENPCISTPRASSFAGETQRPAAFLNFQLERR